MFSGAAQVHLWCSNATIGASAAISEVRRLGAVDGGADLELVPGQLVRPCGGCGMSDERDPQQIAIVGSAAASAGLARVRRAASISTCRA
jgi:hypothetical protein